MKRQVKENLKERNLLNLYTDERYLLIKGVMKIGMKKDKVLKAFLQIDPYNKVEFIADHIIKLVNLNQI